MLSVLTEGKQCHESETVPVRSHVPMDLHAAAYTGPVVCVQVGRPRPNFFYRCFPDGVESWKDGPVQGQREPVCHANNERDVVDGYKSFPSGAHLLLRAGRARDEGNPVDGFKSCLLEKPRCSLVSLLALLACSLRSWSLAATWQTFLSCFLSLFLLPGDNAVCMFVHARAVMRDAAISPSAGRPRAFPVQRRRVR